MGLFGDVFDEVAVDDAAVGVDYDDGAGQQAFKRAVDKLDAIVSDERGGAERRGDDDILDVVGGAESRHCERQIHADADDRGVFALGGFGVETAH